jgi:hypothetical protein
MSMSKVIQTLDRQELEIALAQLRSEVTRDDSRYMRYTTPKGPAPGVTTVLKQLDKPALLYWASKMQSEACEAEVIQWLQEPESERGDLVRRLQAIRQAHKKLSTTAADMGKEGHALAEYEFRRQLGLDAVRPELEHPREANMIFAAIMEWSKANEVEPVSVECPVWSRRYNYAGTWDLAAYVRGVFTILDWKSSAKAKVYREAYLQNHALRGALGEHGITAEGIVIGIPRDGQGDINPVPMPWDDDAYAAFLGLLRVHRWVENSDTL